MKFEKRRLIRYFFELISENRLVVLLPRIWTTFELHQTWCVVNLFWEIGSVIAPTQPEVLACKKTILKFFLKFREKNFKKLTIVTGLVFFISNSLAEEYHMVPIIKAVSMRKEGFLHVFWLSLRVSNHAEFIFLTPKWSWKAISVRKLH